MASTKLDRKARVNITRQRVRKQKMKRQSFQPVIKKVDIEELKKEFEPDTKSTKKTATKKEEKPEEKKEEPKAEKEEKTEKEEPKSEE